MTVTTVAAPSKTINQWVVLELSEKADGEDPDVIRAAIRRSIKDADVFIPANVTKKGAVKEFQYLMEGYAFIRKTHKDEVYFRLDDTKYVTSVLRASGSGKERRVSVVYDRDIAKFRGQIEVETNQGIEAEDEVEIIGGPYKNMSAKVVDDIPEMEQVVVLVEGLRSTSRLITLPRAFLKLKSKSIASTHSSKFLALKKWGDTVVSLSSLKMPSVKSLVETHRKLQFVLKALKLQKEISYLSGEYRKPRDLKRGVQTLSNIQVALELKEALSTKVTVPLIRPLVSALRGLKHAETLLSRHSQTLLQIEYLRKGYPLNLVIDGTQLYIRCQKAPGLGALTDDKGRPTGAITGFLRSLGAFKKRFPDSEIYVCWDGSSQRRKDMFPEYKSNRPQRARHEWNWLQTFLPHLGVHQVTNPNEEADDLMATLVTTTLQGQPNLMITSDKDLLQCVSEFTSQLAPGMGGGSEKLYTPELVMETFGVTPDRMVQLRAIVGDTSDNIPGAHGLGLKIASKALASYKTAEALLKSSMVGLTPKQAASLKASSKQIRLNLKIMELQEVPVTMVSGRSNLTEASSLLKELQIQDTVLAPFFA